MVYNDLQSQVKDILEQHAMYRDVSETEINAALTNVETLENNLRLKDKACISLQAEIKMLTANLENEKRSNEETTHKLAAVEDKTETLEKDASVRDDLLSEVQEECKHLRHQLDETKRDLGGLGRQESDSRLAIGDYMLKNGTSFESLQNDLSTAKETEASLRSYIVLLEEDKAAQDKELEDARQLAEKYSVKYDRLTDNLRADVNEQKLAIDSLVDLLERQRMDHEKESADQHAEIGTLKGQLSGLQMNHQTELVAMKVELQNALNELAEYQHGHKGKV